MKASIKVKSALASFKHLTGINFWKLGRYSKDNIAILMYHRVIPSNMMGSSVQAGMVVEPDTFSAHLRYLRKFFEIIPLSDLSSAQQESTKLGRKKPLCVITFDDGWRDFYDYAYPVLKIHEVPATVFLPTDFIGTDRWFWTDRAGLLLDRIPQSSDIAKSVLQLNNPLLEKLARITGTHEARLEKTISFLKTYRTEKIESLLSGLSASLGENSAARGRAFMSWQEVQEIHADGLVSFGSHTASHPLLTTLTEDEAWQELTKSREALLARRVVDAGFISFTYPNGNFSERLSAMVREAGYHLALTTQYGWHEPGTNPYTLKRIAIHQDMTYTEAMFESRIVNLL